MRTLSLFTFTLLLLSACTNSVDTPDRCSQLKAKLQSQWTTDNAMAYTKNCVASGDVGSQSWCKEVKEVLTNDGWTDKKAQVVGYQEYCEF
ncbi:DUF3012 domain-containing protein [Vibrio sp. S4M6]|uniref:DUF3012 domain-containing protein n=1 Tax=Vibrio sinus TaxID=2946865 RepID=UPI00202A3CC0|nr:DUF3012 domain-containing protein [Vibrio sinus]MCL9783370.1 DUF3012 domain-containing protein [Vibrio sinus]